MPLVSRSPVELAIQRARAWRWAHVESAEVRGWRFFGMSITIITINAIAATSADLIPSEAARWLNYSSNLITVVLAGAIMRLKDQAEVEKHTQAHRAYILASRVGELAMLDRHANEYETLERMYGIMGEAEESAPMPSQRLLIKHGLAHDDAPPPPIRTLTNSSVGSRDYLMAAEGTPDPSPRPPTPPQARAPVVTASLMHPNPSPGPAQPPAQPLAPLPVPASATSISIPYTVQARQQMMS
jgi:hypothetical protein